MIKLEPSLSWLSLRDNANKYSHAVLLTFKVMITEKESHEDMAF